MIEHKNLEQLVEAFAETGKSLNIGYIEIASLSEGKPLSLFFKKLSDSFDLIPLKDIKNYITSEKTKNSGINKFEATSINGEKIRILAASVNITSEISGYVIFQSYKDISVEAEKNILFFSSAFNIISGLSHDQPAEEKTRDKYKKELNNIRDFQAKLFPRFTDVKGFDIASAYLPADLMSGNFIDGLYLDENTYQVTVCDVSKYGATSTFTGAMIRTILKYEATKKITPSLLIETINSKIKSMNSLANEHIYFTTYQLKLKTGKTVLSSYGPITTFLYNSKKNGHVNLKNTEAGKLLAKRNFYKDISLTLDSGDILLYYSNGFCNATTENGTTIYGESRIGERIMELKNEPAMNIIHGLIDSLYEFSNYSSNIEDIILICIKKE